MSTLVLHGRYALRQLLGRGGMAEVWAARDAVLGRDVAVKTVRASTHDPTLADRLRREAVTMAKLNHPDVVTVYDAGVEDGTVFIVMELVPGRDLAAVLREGPLPLPEVLRVGARVAGALAAAHAAGVIHRDIKPGNVLVDGEDVTVVDFGIAAAAQAEAVSLTATGTVVGSAEYMAPEQAGARGASPASDMYAVGCLLMALSTGRPPFTGEHPVGVLHQHVHDAPPRLAQRLPGVPAELDALVAALLDKDPARRPAAEQVRDVLERLAPTAPVLAVPAQADLPTGEHTPAPAAVPGTAAAAFATAPVSSTPVTAATEPARPERPERPARKRLLAGAGAVAAAVFAALVIVPGFTTESPGAGKVAHAAEPVATEAPSPSPTEDEPPPQPESPPVDRPAPQSQPTPEPVTPEAPQVEPPAAEVRIPDRLPTDRGEMAALIASLGLDDAAAEELWRRWEEMVGTTDTGAGRQTPERTKETGPPVTDERPTEDPAPPAVRDEVPSQDGETPSDGPTPGRGNDGTHMPN